MTWRVLLGKLSFPLLVGVLLLWGSSAWYAREQRAELERIAAAAAKAADAQAAYDAKHLATKMIPNDVSNCGIRDYGYSTVDVDGDPHHTLDELWTELHCKEGTLTIHGKLPRLVTTK